MAPDLISKIVLGTVQFGLNYGVSNLEGKPSKEQVFEMLSTAYDKGLRTLDTAALYGNAHELIGKFHAKYPDKIFKVNTKFGEEIASSQSLVETVESYCENLRVKEISCLMFHSYADYSKGVDFLSQLKDRLPVAQIGCSIYTNEEAERLIEDKLVDVVQLPFNLLDNWNQRGQIIASLKDSGFEVHVRSVFLQGLFFMEKEEIQKKKLSDLVGDIDSLEKINDKSGYTMEEIALLYPFHFSQIDKVLLGVNSLSQLEKNIAALGRTLSPSSVKQIKTIFVKNPDLLNPSKW